MKRIHKNIIRKEDSDNMKEKNNKLTVPELISIGVFTALYFVLVAIATFLSAALLPGFSNVLLPAIAALVAGCVYMLMVSKVPHFGGITVMGTVMGLFLFVSGHFAVSLIIGIGCSALADFIAKLGGYRNKKGILASYIVFSFGLTGPVLLLWLMKDAYIASLQAKGKDAAYIDGVFSHINGTTLVVCIAATLVLAIVGGMFGQKMMKKHFEKAGIV